MNKPITLYLIDDDPDDQEFFIDAINEVDGSIKCFISNSCEEALKALKNEVIKPDYIFLDLNMPKIDGKTCLVEIKKMAKICHIPVIIYSTSSSKRDIEETKTLGAVHFLTKPSAFKELCDALSNILSTKFTKGVTY